MNQDNQPFFNLLVAFNLAETAVTDEGFPKKNFIGTILLNRLLNANLEAAGQLLRPGFGSGALNHSLYIFAVRDVHAAAEIVRAATLPEIQTTIFRFDEVEGIFRRIGSSNGKDLQLAEVQLALSAASSQVAQGLERLNKFQALLQAQSAQPLPPPSNENPG